MKNETYDRDYFIAFFEAIPADKFVRGILQSSDGTRRCALGHLIGADQGRPMGATLNSDYDKDENRVGALGRLIGNFGAICQYNNGTDFKFGFTDMFDTTDGREKERVLAFLRSLPDPKLPAIEGVTVTEVPSSVPEYVPMGYAYVRETIDSEMLALTLDDT